MKIFKFFGGPKDGASEPSTNAKHPAQVTFTTAPDPRKRKPAIDYVYQYAGVAQVGDDLEVHYRCAELNFEQHAPTAQVAEETRRSPAATIKLFEDRECKCGHRLDEHTKSSKGTLVCTWIDDNKSRNVVCRCENYSPKPLTVYSDPDTPNPPPAIPAPAAEGESQ